MGRVMVALTLVFLVACQGGGSATPSATPQQSIVVVVPPEPEPVPEPEPEPEPDCLPIRSVIKTMKAVGQAFTDGGEAARYYDVEGMVSALARAELLLRDTADLTVVDRAISEPLRKAAKLIGRARGALEEGDLFGSTALIERGAELVQRSSRAVGRTSVLAC